jgi:hypothetical protein
MKAFYKLMFASASKTKFFINENILIHKICIDQELIKISLFRK